MFNRWLRLLAVSLVVVVGVGASLSSALSDLISPAYADILRAARAGTGVVAAFAGVVGLVWFMTNFLRKPTIGQTNIRELEERVSALLQAQKAAIAQSEAQAPTTTVALDSEQRKTIVAEAKQQVSKEITEDIVRDIRASFERELNSSVQIDAANVALTRVAGRLSDACDEVRNRANLNLIMGTVACSVGVMMLLALVFWFPQGEAGEPWEKTALVRTLPRLSLVIIIELVGYFFLGLYRLGTSELKFFQNELTNVELWAISYMHAMRVNDHTLIGDIVKKLLSVERNFIIKKGETTAFSAGEPDKEGLRSDLKALADVARLLKQKPEGKG